MKRFINVVLAMLSFTGLGLVVYFTQLESPVYLIPVIVLFFLGAYFMGMIGNNVNDEL